MLKLTEQIVKDKLADLVGQKVGYGAYEAETRLCTLLREYAQANGLDPYQFRATKENKGWTMLLTYKGYDIGAVDIKREKGKHHYTYWGNGYNDWTYKEFCLWLWIYPEKNEDVETRIAEIDKLELAREKAKQDKKAHGKEVIELLKTTYNLDNYGVRSLIEYLNSNKYTLTE